VHARLVIARNGQRVRQESGRAVARCVRVALERQRAKREPTQAHERSAVVRVDSAVDGHLHRCSWSHANLHHVTTRLVRARHARQQPTVHIRARHAHASRRLHVVDGAAERCLGAGVVVGGVATSVRSAVGACQVVVT
jgi:hypothetical protein